MTSAELLMEASEEIAMGFFFSAAGSTNQHLDRASSMLARARAARAEPVSSTCCFSNSVKYWNGVGKTKEQRNRGR